MLVNPATWPMDVLGTPVAYRRSVAHSVQRTLERWKVTFANGLVVVFASFGRSEAGRKPTCPFTPVWGVPSYPTLNEDRRSFAFVRWRFSHSRLRFPSHN